MVVVLLAVIIPTVQQTVDRLLYSVLQPLNLVVVPIQNVLLVHCSAWIHLLNVLSNQQPLWLKVETRCRCSSSDECWMLVPEKPPQEFKLLFYVFKMHGFICVL